MCVCLCVSACIYALLISLCIYMHHLLLQSLPSQKKRRKSSGDGRKAKGSPMIAVGTKSGSIVLYNIAEGGIVGTLQDAHKAAVKCISWEKEADLFTCATDYIVHWNVSNKSVRK